MKNTAIGSALSISALFLLSIVGFSLYRSKVFLPSGKSAARKPNIILFLSDDTGYADFHSFGHPIQEWGPIDDMAKEGMKFTQWTTAEKVCSPSRAGLLTGRYPVRTGVYGRRLVFHQDSSGGLPKREVTLAEALKEQGYSTGMVGKWHLGINKKNNSDGLHLPVHHGFDYVGLNMPFSQHWKCKMGNPANVSWSMCFLYDNTTIVEQPINLNTLTRRMVRDSKKFINKNKDGPFFFYFSLAQTHEALFCDEQFCGKSRRGPYGDNINEMAWAVGEVLREVKKLGIEENTLAIFTSDSGTSDFTCRDEGSGGVFRGGKGTTWEGGLRVPTVLWWPGTIPAGSISHNFVNAMDIFPTALQLAGAPDYAASKNITIDGQVIPELIEYNSTQPRRNFFIYYCSDRVMAARYNEYKVHYYTLGMAEAKIANHETSRLCQHVKKDVMAEYNCYGENVITWDPPLVFNIMVDAEERLRLNTSTPEIRKVLGKVQSMIDTHEKNIVRVPSELDRHFDRALIPCCNPPACTCNYEG